MRKHVHRWKEANSHSLCCVWQEKHGWYCPNFAAVQCDSCSNARCTKHKVRTRKPKQTRKTFRDRAFDTGRDKVKKPRPCMYVIQIMGHRKQHGGDGRDVFLKRIVGTSIDVGYFDKDVRRWKTKRAAERCIRSNNLDFLVPMMVVEEPKR